ncbi:MAG: BatA and WFA domain-containing protein [Anaerolineae bacterium]
MAFLAPFALILGLMAIPILLLYMLRLRRREVQVSSTLLWQQLLQDREANAPWQKLRRNLLLFLQLLILAALVLALARPYIEVPSVTSGRTALLIDASASMSATDVQPSRFEVARAQALEIVNTLTESDQVAVIRVAEGPELLVSYTNDQNLLREAINAMQPSKGIPDWNAALTLAAAGAQGAEEFTILLLTDGGIPADLDTQLYGEVRAIPIGTSDQNVAISALAPAYDAQSGAQLYARLTNFGAQPADVIFSITLDGTLHNAAPYTVPANSYVDVTIRDLPAEFRRVEAAITRPASSSIPDYVSLDDVAYATYTPASAGRALIITRGNRFIEEGLSALPDWSVFKGDPSRGLPTGEYDLYVFDGWLPAELPNANLLVINPPADIPLPDFLTVSGLSQQTKVTRVLADDPRTRYLRFNEVNIRQFKQISAPWADVLVEAEGGGLIFAGTFGDYRAAILSFNLFDSDLPLRIAFPILLANLTAWYKAPRAISLDGSLQPGQTLVIQPPAEVQTVRVIRPDGATSTYSVDQPLIIYTDTPLTGIYHVDMYAGETLLRTEYFAVNLFSEAESQIAPRQVGLVGGGTAADTPQEIGQREFWHIAAMVALAILALEWYLYHKRRGLPRLKTTTAARFARRS